MSSKPLSAWPSFQTMTRLIGEAAREAEAVTGPQPEDLVEAEVVAAVIAEIENPYARVETAEIARSVGTVGSETIVEGTVGIGMTDVAGQAETAHVPVLVIAEEATAPVAEAVTAATEIVIALLHTEMATPSKPGSKPKSRSARQKRKNISLRRKRLKRKACPFLGGLIGEENILLLHATGMMIVSLVRHRIANGMILVIEIETGVVRGRLELEADLAHLLVDVEVVLRDLQVLSTSTGTFLVHQIVGPAQLVAHLGSGTGAEIGTVTEIETGTEKRTEIVDEMTKSIDARAAPVVAAGDEIGAETETAPRQEVAAVARM